MGSRCRCGKSGGGKGYYLRLVFVARAGACPWGRSVCFDFRSALRLDLLNKPGNIQDKRFKRGKWRRRLRRRLSALSVLCRINIERAAALAKLKSILSGGERRNLVINSDDLFVTPVIYKCDIR
jgi:hypothetical protein